MKDKRVEQQKVVLFDFDEFEDFYNGFAKNEEWQIEKCISNWSIKSKVDNIRRYWKYFVFSFKIFSRRKKYSHIVAWQQFYALIYCFWCRVFHVKKRNTVVALNFTYKHKDGISGRLYKWFMSFIVKSKYLDYMHVLSFEYVKDVCKEFGISEDKFLVSPFGVPDLFSTYKDSTIPDEYANLISKDFVLSIGRSNRDYEFLIDAWKDINDELVIICDTLNIDETKLPKNIHIIRTVSGDQQYPFIYNCKFLILPIKLGNICSGDTVLLTAMSFEKTVVITKPSTLAEMYVKDGVNGYAIAKDRKELKRVISQVKISSQEIGKNARESYLEEYSQYALGNRIHEMLKERSFI